MVMMRHSDDDVIARARKQLTELRARAKTLELTPVELIKVGLLEDMIRARKKQIDTYTGTTVRKVDTERS